MQTDRVPPQALEVEESVLASCIQYSDDLDKTVDILSPSDFYRTAHQTIFKACRDFHYHKSPVDLATLTTALRDSGKLEEIGGPVFLATLIESPVSTNIDHSCSILKQKATLRKLIEISHKTISDCHTCPSEALDRAQRRVLSIDDGNHGDTLVEGKELVTEANDRYQEMQNHQGEITGIPSGFHLLDGLTCGFQNSDLIVIAARPSMGKTAFALNIASNIGYEGRSVLFFSLEMAGRQVSDRIISSESGVNGQKFKTGNFSKEDWIAINEASGQFYNWPFLLDDSSSLSYREIIRRTRRAKRDHGIELVVIDYLQYVTGDQGQGKNYEIESITRGLKGLAKDLDIPVLLLSQLNRKCEERPHPYKRPQLSDLRDSGAIEQDADLVLFLYRPERHGEKDEHGNDQLGIAEIEIAKHRNGPLGCVKLKWFERITKFENLQN